MSSIFTDAIWMADSLQEFIKNMLLPLQYKLMICGHSLGQRGTSCLLRMELTRVRNNSGRAGEVFRWEREENPIENCGKPPPSTEMKVFEVFSVAGPELFPNRNCS
jgi:hypothetical protein